MMSDNVGKPSWYCSLCGQNHLRFQETPWSNPWADDNDSDVTNTTDFADDCRSLHWWGYSGRRPQQYDMPLIKPARSSVCLWPYGLSPEEHSYGPHAPQVLWESRDFLYLSPGAQTLETTKGVESCLTHQPSKRVKGENPCSVRTNWKDVPQLISSPEFPRIPEVNGFETQSEEYRTALDDNQLGLVEPPRHGSKYQAGKEVKHLHKSENVHLPRFSSKDKPGMFSEPEDLLSDKCESNKRVLAEYIRRRALAAKWIRQIAESDTEGSEGSSQTSGQTWHPPCRIIQKERPVKTAPYRSDHVLREKETLPKEECKGDVSPPENFPGFIHAPGGATFTPQWVRDLCPPVTEAGSTSTNTEVCMVQGGFCYIGLITRMGIFTSIFQLNDEMRKNWLDRS